ncbi:glycoside hydrolase family 32 protein [Luteolibacter flavescens]|uniref:Glycoside hydrolase family 32 protein n=1 Tax=Luteolibacter flavescens TaxID=1859460 RepID=A0ABT3FLA2_9BACT|nr:glycoside hydrolase family 32 protein [Luteolibacter flavescens]MCW1884363.1 glycoside hydrolase family 32 protein [Luteolibacter flavescens]
MKARYFLAPLLTLSGHAAGIAGFTDWKKSGTAFEKSPATGDLIETLEIRNAPDGPVATSEIDGDGPRGFLSSPAFTIDRNFIAFSICGGDYEKHCCMNLIVDGKIVRSATGRNHDRLTPASWDVSAFRGKEARIEIVDQASGQWGHINVAGLSLTDAPAAYPVATEPLYQEALRPQFHFTARQWTMDRLNPGMRQEGWINDLNGLVYHDGEYHLFAQRWHKCWLHAVSKDLIHWEELEPAFWATELDEGVQSGSCVIDHDNTSGLSNEPKNPPMIAFWSTVDNRSQCISYSLDKGRTWTIRDKDPVLVFPERDPKVFWYEPGKHWVMFLYGNGKYHVFTSKNLLEWKDEKNPIDHSYECPDFFELAVEGSPSKKKWVLVQADGKYSIGSFDGVKFTPESDRIAADIHDHTFYATQSWNNMERSDGRRIQTAWMRGSNFPGMPFNQQISFPCELTLHDTPVGLRVFRKPIREIEKLHASEKTAKDVKLASGETKELAASGDLFRIKAEVDLPEGSRLKFLLRGVPLVISGKSIQVGETRGEAIGTVKNIEILLDRGSLEAFVNDGEISSTNFVLPNVDGLSVTAEGGPATIHSISVYPLKSIWQK